MKKTFVGGNAEFGSMPWAKVVSMAKDIMEDRVLASSCSATKVAQSGGMVG